MQNARGNFRPVISQDLAKLRRGFQERVERVVHFAVNWERVWKKVCLKSRVENFQMNAKRKILLLF